MNSDEKYRNTLQKLLESKHFVYSDANWQSTRQYIDAQNKKRRKRIVILTALGILLLGLSWLFIPEKQTTLLSQADPGTTEYKPKQDLEKNKELHISPIEKTTEPAGSVNTPDALPLEQKEHRNTTAIKKGTDVANEKMVDQAPVPLPAEDAAIKNNGQKTHDQPENKVRSVQNPPQPIGSTRASQLSVSLPEKSDPKNEAGSEAEKATLMISEAKNNLLAEHPEKKAVDGSTQVQPNPAKSDPANEQSLLSQPENTLLKNDSIVMNPASAASLSVVPDSLKALSVVQSYLSLEAGFSYFPDLKNAPAFGKRNFNPSIGLSYNKYVKPEVILSFGIFYNRVFVKDPSSIVSKSISYSYGEESMVTAISPERLHYLTMPFRLGWQFKPGHIISAGYNISYLFNVEAQVEKYNESINGISDRRSYRADGFTEGFRIFESQAALIYRARIRKSLAFQGEFDLGLTDIKDNVFFNSAKFERNVGVKFMLVYDLHYIR